MKIDEEYLYIGFGIFVILLIISGAIIINYLNGESCQDACFNRGTPYSQTIKPNFGQKEKMCVCYHLNNSIENFKLNKNVCGKIICD